MAITETPFLLDRICNAYTTSGKKMSKRQIICDLASRYRLIKSPEVLGWFTAGIMNALIPDLYSSPTNYIADDGSMTTHITVNHNHVKGFASQAAIYLRESHHYRASKRIVNNFRYISRASMWGEADLMFVRPLGRYNPYKDYVALNIGDRGHLGRFQDFLTIAFGMSPTLTTNVYMSILRSSISNI